jgi:hypothetical protein
MDVNKLPHSQVDALCIGRRPNKRFYFGEFYIAFSTKKRSYAFTTTLYPVATIGRTARMVMVY